MFKIADPGSGYGERRPVMRTLASFTLPGLVVVATSGSPVQAVDYVWTDGNFVVGVTAPSPLVPPDTLSIDAGTVAKLFVGVSFANQSTVTWNAGDLGFVSSLVSNAGLWDAKDDLSLRYASGNPSTFSNTGTFRKSGGSGVSAVGNNIVFVNSGTVDAQSGTIDFASGNATFNGGTQFTGAGVNRVSNNAMFVDGFTSGNLVLSGGTFTGGGASAGAVMNGNVTWTGGSFAGTWQVASGQTLVAGDGTGKTFVGSSFTNHGTVNWQTA
ncbi:MAG: hypothetical protein GC151_00910, partial [Betaproteobacteria bacterium]|nr:hypothetical protein [Betaproteobacteria bacterium]